jgi:diguanylate cyclase (GGDEF)-like protein/PAS domain S-box-containing protein
MGLDGAGLRARLRGAVSGDRGGQGRYRAMLPRLRWSFAAFTALVALGALTQLGAAGVANSWLVTGGLLGLAGWAGIMVLARARWTLDLLGAVPLTVLAMGFTRWWILFPFVHVVIFQRALHGGQVRAYLGALLVGGAPLATSFVITSTTPRLAHAALPPSLLVSTWLLRQVRVLAEEVERGARREQRLLAASRELAVAGDQGEVNEIVVAAALDLLEQADARATLWEEGADQWVAVAGAGLRRVHSVSKLRLPPGMQGRAAIGEPWVLSPSQAAELQARLGLQARFRGFVLVPLPRASGPHAVLMVSCPGSPDPALPETLRRFAQEIALAEERARLVSEVADREARLASILEGSADIIAELDADGRFTMINQATVRTHGYEPEDLLGRSVFDLIPKEDRGYVLRTTLAGDLTAGVSLAHRLYDARGRVRHVESRLSRPHPDAEEYILNTRDVTERKALEAEILYRAHHDTLTGLANRSAFTDRLELALARGRRSGNPVSLLMADLDGFKPVNDTHGHHAGDAVLVEVADRLRAAIRETDLAARVGGDEFAVIVEDTGSDPAAAAGDLAERLADAVAAAIRLPHGGQVRVSISIGVATSGPDSDADTLMREADRDLYVHKRTRAASRPISGRGSGASV